MVTKRVDEYLTQIGDAPLTYLVRIPSPQVVSGATNCFVVFDGDEQLIVDVGPHTSGGARIWKNVRDRLGLDASRLKLFFTHLHVDHAGMIRELEFGRAPVYVPRANWEDYRYRFDAVNYELERARWRLEGFPGSDQRAMAFFGPAYYTPLPAGLNLQLLDAGETVAVGAACFELVDTSGHVPGHTSLFHAASGLLFDGDHILFDITPVIEPSAYKPDIVGIYLENLQKVGNMELSLHCHSHGRLQEPGAHAQQAERLAARERRRIERAFDVIEHRQGLTGFEVITRMGWNTGGLFWGELGLALRNCILYNGMAMIDHLLARGIVCREPDRSGAYRYYLS